MPKTDKERLQDNNTALLRIKGKAQNLPDVGGDVKLFDTVEHMQADTNPSDGDLAIVYREEIQPVTEDSKFSSCIFPNTVVLDEAFSDNIYERFRSTGSGFFDGMVDMSSSNFRFNGYGESSQVRVQYESQDGITYTRTDSGEELQEFGTTIKWEDRGDPFNSVIGNFMQVSGNYFDGMYEYAINLVDATKLYWCNVSDCTVTWSETRNEVTSFVVNAKTNNYIDGNTLKQLIPDIQMLYSSATINNVTFFLNTSDELCFVIESYGNSAYNLAYNKTSGNSPVGIGLGVGANMSQATLYKVDSSLTSFTKVRDIAPTQSGSWKYTPLTDIKTIPITINLTGKATSSNLVFTSANFDTTITNSVDCKSYYNYYLPVNTQLDATSDYVYEKTFYGKNGVENGTLTTSVSNSFADVNAGVYAQIQEQYDNMQPRVLTDQDKTINRNIYFIPCRSDGTLLLDISNVTNMWYMFSSCANLKSIPLLDTSNATNMGYMFSGCTNLKSIPLLDTSNVTSMESMFSMCSSLTTIPLLDTGNVTSMNNTFYMCSSLTTIPLLDTSNVTNMNSLFGFCTSLTTVPLLDTSSTIYTTTMFRECISLTTIPLLDTSSSTDMYDMFNGCISLTTVPLLNTSNVTRMNNMFNNCNSLTNESLNNILAMCTNATKITSNKTLKHIGLTQEQATTCQGLSNYQAFVNAGWTTGY